jgi:LysR family glycine cleavage system transcriptional activator
MEKRRLPPLGSLRAFEAAARHLSFKKAAEELAVTPTAVSHQIRLLEDTLGITLFRRQARRVLLTEPGQRLFPVLREGFDAFSEALADISAQRSKPSVTITATTAFSAHWLLPRLPALGRASPKTSLSILATEDVLDLHDGRADIAIRRIGTVPPGHDSALLRHDCFGVMATASMSMNTLQDLERATLIQFDWKRNDADTPDWPKWLAAAGASNIRPKHVLRFSDESQALQAAIAGQGVGLFSLAVAGESLRIGLLQLCFPITLPGKPYYLMRSSQKLTTPHAAGVWEWLLSSSEPE